MAKKTLPVVTGQRVVSEGPDFLFLVNGLEGNQVGNIPTVVLQNWYEENDLRFFLKNNNRLYSNCGEVRYATAFAIADKNGKILLVNRNAQEQEIINDGIDLSHAGATIHPISIHYKLGLMNDSKVFSVLGAKINSVEFMGYAEEDVNGDDEKKCIMPVWLIKTDFDSSDLKCFYNIKNIKTKVTAKVATLNK